jgi:hypothetical protein
MEDETLRSRPFARVDYECALTLARVRVFVLEWAVDDQLGV